LQRTALGAHKIVAFLKPGISPTAFLIYRCAAAEAQGVGRHYAVQYQKAYHPEATPMISTHDLSQLPDIARLKAISQSLAMLDAILCPKWEYRYYSFNAHWSEDEMMASMRNGSGDEYFILFTTAGAIIKGFAHEAPMTPYTFDPPHVWPGVLDTVPSVFAAFLTEPAFIIEDTTFCVWRTYHDSVWHRGTIEFPDDPDPDGSQELLAILDGDLQTYQAYAETYYERSIDLDTVVQVYNHQPLRDALVGALNPDLSFTDISADREEIGYPG